MDIAIHSSALKKPAITDAHSRLYSGKRTSSFDLIFRCIYNSITNEIKMIALLQTSNKISHAHPLETP